MPVDGTIGVRARPWGVGSGGECSGNSARIEVGCDCRLMGELAADVRPDTGERSSAMVLQSGEWASTCSRSARWVCRRLL